MSVLPQDQPVSDPVWSEYWICMNLRWFRAVLWLAIMVWFAKNASGAKTHVSTSIANGSQEPEMPDAGHVTLCYMAVDNQS